MDAGNNFYHLKENLERQMKKEINVEADSEIISWHIWVRYLQGWLILCGNRWVIFCNRHFD